MILMGNPKVFAIESHISRAYPDAGRRALGFFVLHLNGTSYGVRAPDATLLACSFDAVVVRLHRRGSHVVDVPSSAYKLATAFLRGRYPKSGEEVQAGDEELAQAIVAHGCEWAPDGDEAFDDGSFILHFDVRDQVRLVGFRRNSQPSVAAALSEVWLAADDFYRVLHEWSFAFESHWQNMITIARPQ